MGVSAELAVSYVRHGEVADRRPGDVELSALGREMAARTAGRLVGLSPTRVLSSPLARAKETADIIAHHFGMVVELEPRLRERMNWGDIPGQSFGDFVEMWVRCDRDRDYIPFGGAVSARRCGDSLNEVLYDCAPAGGPVVVVGHGGALFDFLRNAVEQRRLDHFDDTKSVHHCSVTTLRWTPEQVRVTELADASHLIDLLAE